MAKATVRLKIGGLITDGDHIVSDGIPVEFLLGVLWQGKNMLRHRYLVGLVLLSAYIQL